MCTNFRNFLRFRKFLFATENKKLRASREMWRVCAICNIRLLKIRLSYDSIKLRFFRVEHFVYNDPEYKPKKKKIGPLYILFLLKIKRKRKNTLHYATTSNLKSISSIRKRTNVTLLSFFLASFQYSILDIATTKR